MWTYNSPIGTIIIKFTASQNAYSIIIDNMAYGRYKSPVAAADDVYTFSTGCYEWDQHCADLSYILGTPTDIYEWTKE